MGIGATTTVLPLRSRCGRGTVRAPHGPRTLRVRSALPAEGTRNQHHRPSPLVPAADGGPSALRRDRGRSASAAHALAYGSTRFRVVYFRPTRCGTVRMCFASPFARPVFVGNFVSNFVGARTLDKVADKVADKGSLSAGGAQQIRRFAVRPNDRRMRPVRKSSLI